ncbi:hypothetical protein SAMN05443429_10941 [Cruoricaptor ignavus]|uniref:DNA-binding beta-propeller fold protein YncE n=1 Tax=Cruoricaptor ignavus TaxID=1118202 RepID=A0A1M6GK69_9FLAO|nr:DUF5074 domain-containing protein [Cruoricaptor ignavus]SHJ10318.1 hypothetical protein SAMN05443429_10941 [Cruoricaptor ignavus]
MNTNKILKWVFAASLAVTVSCSDDNDPIVPKGAYENGILVVNEGNFGKGNSSVSFLDSNGKISNDIYSAENNGEKIGDILQSISFSGDDAYFVVNNSNKINVVNRYTLKKKTEIKNEMKQPRYAAFSNKNLYVTSNGYNSTSFVYIYNKNDHAFLKKIEFPRYAEKIAEAGGNIFVQTDGIAYSPTTWQPVATGHTISRINANSNAVDKTIELTDTGIIRDMISASGALYVLSSDSSGSFVYRINGQSAAFEKISLGIPNAQDLAADGGKLYIRASEKVYNMPLQSNTAPSSSVSIPAQSVYGFNVIDGKIYIASSTFTENSTVYVYDLAGKEILQTKAGMGANGFYKN